MTTRENNNMFQIKPPPPPNLSKELLGVWSAWSRMGDREVVREAVAKGSHVDWAFTFLSARRGLEPVITQHWFKDEVYIWVSELLTRRQVFKASHIMSNINLDPFEEFTRIFIETNDCLLRNYLGNHLDKQGKLEIDYKETWNLLQIIEKNLEYLLNFDENLNGLNLKIVHNRSFDWKCDIGTQLFFKTYDVSIKSFVTAVNAWKYLLMNDNLDLLKLWINVYFTKTQDFKFVNLNPQALNELTQIFLNFEINSDMINSVSKFSNSKETETGVFDELSKFGVFNEIEQNNVIDILTRVVNNKNLDCLYEILSRDTSTINLFQFNQMLIKFCADYELYSVLNWCKIDLTQHENLIQTLKSKYLDLICYLRKNNNDLCEIKNVGQNILKISKFLSDDLKIYFKSNPLLLLSIFMLLFDDVDLLELLKSTNDTEFKIEDFSVTPEVLKNILTELPFLNSIINRSSNQNLTFQDLLKIHGDLDTDNFSFRLDNNLVPNFNSKILVQKYGYNKRINYIFYLNQSRPSFAKEMFGLNSNNDSQTVMKKILKLTAQNILNKEITSGCVAFLEMIGLDSKNLRIYIKSATVLYESGQFTLGEVQEMLQKINPEQFLEALEKILIQTCSLLSPDYSGSDLIEEIKKHDIAIKFAQIHNLKHPELFLENCAKHNLWLPFLLYIQIHHYPLSDVQKLLQHFQNPTLAEHLLHGLSNDIQVDEQKTLLMRDSRKDYLSRIGVRKSFDGSSMDAMQSMISSMSSYGSHGSTSSSSGGSDFLESEHLDFKTDLLQTLIRCHSSIDPPKALLQACYVYKSPIFAVLATSYEPDSIITNWLTWLSVSCDVETEFCNFEATAPSSSTIVELMKATVENGYGKLLHESLQIFLPENPLQLFVDFLNQSVNLNFDTDFGKQNLIQFEHELKQRKSSTPTMDIDYEMMYLSSKTWIETTACTLLATSLQHNFASQYNQLRFLKFLHDIRIEKYFSIPIPDFLKFYDILNYLFQSKCDIKLNLSVIFDNQIIESELSNCIRELVSKKFYDCAFKIAKLQGIVSDFIVIKEWEDKFDNEPERKDFWEKCNYVFRSAEVQGTVAVDFFERCAEKTDDKTEKYKILTFAYKWASFHNLENLYDVEKKMWMAYFDVETRMADCEFVKVNQTRMLYAEMKQKLLYLQNGGPSSMLSSSTLTEDETLHLNKTIEKLLNVGDFWQALRLGKIFDHQTTDLEIITLCYSLAEGILMPYQLTAEQRMFLMNKTGHFRTFSHRRRRTLISSRGLSSFSSGASHSPGASTIIALTDHVDVPFQDTLMTLESLVDRVKNGSEIVQNILMTYRISVNIEKSYQEVFKCTDPFCMLKEALNEDCSNKLEVVHDFSLLFKWSKEQIADLLSEELINVITEHIKSKVDPVTLWNLNLNTDFHLILQLLVENCSILGLKLYKYASALHKSQIELAEDMRISEINLVIELLIRSHDCFATDCNMEGISTILRKSQTIITLLLTLKSWKLIVRLLTGVARYTEMNYVFHILRENDQFEFLLRKGSRKDNGLKVALLKYLKKYCPEDRELYRMVALHFTLFSEIAQLWEEEARSIVRNLIAISKLEMQNNGLNIETQPYVLFTNTDGTKICLNKAMVNYTHATEYHLQGEKLAKAMSSAKQAELLALQISMLKGLTANSTTICILNLSDVQILSLISMELSFSQSLILVEAYNHKADWATAIFEQFVISNHANYLDGYLGSFPLTDTLVHDISRKFLSLKAISDTTTRNMKEIVNKSSSIRTKYRIASELGFSDLVEELLIGNQLAFLKDTVWKKGYKS